MTGTRKRYLEETLASFKSSGADLAPEKKKRMEEIEEKKVEVLEFQKEKFVRLFFILHLLPFRKNCTRKREREMNLKEEGIELTAGGLPISIPAWG